MVSTGVKRFFIIGGLFLAAGFMIFAWIGHLLFKKPSFMVALLISMAFVIPEYLLNTYITRYSKLHNVFTPAQLATISIVSGIFAIFLYNTFVLKEKPEYKDIGGFLLVAGGGTLILLDT